MAKRSLRTWINNAAAVFPGSLGVLLPVFEPPDQTSMTAVICRNAADT